MAPLAASPPSPRPLPPPPWPVQGLTPTSEVLPRLLEAVRALEGSQAPSPPTPTASPAVEKRRAAMLVALAAGPLSTAALARVAGVDRYVARNDLVALEKASLVEHLVTRSKAARSGAAMWARRGDNRLRGAALEAAAKAKANQWAAPRGRASPNTSTERKRWLAGSTASRQFRLLGLDGDSEDLSGYTVTAYCKPDAGGATFSRSCTVVTAATGDVSFSLGSQEWGHLAGRGFRLQFKAVNGGTTRYYPEDGPVAVTLDALIAE